MISQFFFPIHAQAGFKDHTVEAILHYKQASQSEPSTERQQCTEREPCTVLNCPFDYFPAEQHLKCHRISDMVSADVGDDTPEWRSDSEEYFLNFAFPGQDVTPGSVNGRKFEYPGINSLFQSHQVKYGLINTVLNINS